MKIYFIGATAAILLAMIFAINGCGGSGGENGTPPQEEEEKVTKLIEAESGGTVALNNGISLYIPPNALNEDTSISLSSVDITQFDGDAEVQGGVNGLHIIGAVFEPDGTVLNTPAVVRFPLPNEWVNESTLDWYAGQGKDPLEVLPTGEEVTVVGTPGAYTAEVKLSHFSVGLVSYNCHSGTFRNIMKKFIERGCSEQQILKTVKLLYEFEIDEKQAENMGRKHIQAFLDTYFDNRNPYGENEPISAETIAELKEYIENGRQVVVAFNTDETWPDRNTDGNEFYKPFAHTANLEIDDNGIVQMRHTIQYQPSKDADKIKTRYHTLLLPENMGPTLSYTYPLDEINEFRTRQNGEVFKEYVLTNYKRIMQENQFTISNAKYRSVNIYVERSEGHRSEGHPGASEVCDDGVDNDCDCLTDCDDPDCSDDSVCVPPIDLSHYNRVSFKLTSYFVQNDWAESFKHTSTLEDYGFNGTFSGNTYTVDKTKTTEDGRWTRAIYITIVFDGLHENITKIDYKNTYKDITTQYREEKGLKTKSGSGGVSLISSSSTPGVYNVEGDQVCEIVESFFKRRYHSGNGELFDYIEHESCDNDSSLTITLYE